MKKQIVLDIADIEAMIALSYIEEKMKNWQIISAKILDPIEDDKINLELIIEFE